ncbi:hypothetical protein RBSH_03518 [Rhodopirellula baltica SH28]|uniref:Uncharacterized protein n=1 Tax=Rhodopirellula baltica SH28 TaxID=993517 RepID=K5DFE5_RHOBT|nr:hypothetical protein RBSH_03518 [Rhodopirellula baltica SH28]
MVQLEESGSGVIASLECYGQSGEAIPSRITPGITEAARWMLDLVVV